ncbi:MAG: hypothetical protein U9N33_02005 [Campylobacterota bacterium]|nr:hypothetical protein [Campylobacterota bacterium]
MSKKHTNSFSSVISVNPYRDTYLTGISSFISEDSSPSFKKEQYAISFLNTKDFINSHISISKNIPEEDLYDAISNKAYDELALDQAVSYQVHFIETFNTIDEENRNFHIFIIDPLIVDETFINTTKKIKYLDMIIPSPLLFKSLYSKELIESNNTHCFIYFQENDAFITVYSDKEFLYTKSINYSYIQMHERFCEIYGEQIEYADFVRFLSTQTLKNTASDYKESFIKLNKEIFANINDILTYVKRAYELSNIEHVYIGSQIDIATKLDEICEVELHIKSSNLEFDYGFENNDQYIEQIHALMHVYTTLPVEDRYDCNFTMYYRPPKFIRRDSGKLILLTAASFVLAFLYPVTYWVLTYAQTLQYDHLKTEYAELHNVKITREATLKNKEADKEKVLALLTTQQKEYSDKKATLIKIHDVKVNYPMKAKLIAKFTKDLNKFKINIKTLSFTEDDKSKTFAIELVSKKEKKITQMIEHLTKVYENRYDFSLNHIQFNEKSKRYFSELKVSIL